MAKQIVERNKQYNEESAQQEQEMIARIKPTNLGHWANIINTSKAINLKRNISTLTPVQKQQEVGVLNDALPLIIRRMDELQVKISEDVPQTQSLFSFLGRSDKERLQKIAQEKSDKQTEYGELTKLQRDIQEQLPYYKTGGKRRTKRIKRTRLR